VTTNGRKQPDWVPPVPAPPPPADPDDPVVLAAEAKRAVRQMQRFTAEQRADRAASHRMGHQQRRAVGDMFYTHPDVSGLAFDSPARAARAALDEAWRAFFAFFDVIVIHTSGGKDSQTVLRLAMRLIIRYGALGKACALHLVLDKDDPAQSGPRVEWDQVPLLAAVQADRNGLPLAAVRGWAVWDAHRNDRAPASRSDWSGRMHYARREFTYTAADGRQVAGDLLDDIATRRKRDGVTMRGWPTMWTRYCTSDWKTAVGRAFTERVCQQIRAEHGLTRPVRVLQIMGFRAEESRDRADRPPFAVNYGVSAQTLRHTWEWLPIHTMTTVQVWQDIRGSGVPYHPAYDEGMSRLSCRVCIMASGQDLANARRLAPDTFAAYAQVEEDLDDSFQHRRRLADVTAAPGRVGLQVRWDRCPDCRTPVLARDWETGRGCPAHATGGPWAADQPPAAGSCASGWAQLDLFGGKR
jgi:3'-phosphoadenosine 5'-phosphosulfate sulfotransferase (PAPS reductase)/FAD synthetase